MVPLDSETVPSILDVLLKRDEEREELPRHHNIPPYTLKHAGAIATADVPTPRTTLTSEHQCTNRHCPYQPYTRGKDGRQVASGPIRCTGDCCY
ncbi:MAG: hypothetical protein WAW00_00400 [Candidatus Moraniibacteriota bacterium]